MNDVVVRPVRTWPFAVGVAAIALGAGVLIAGVPRSSQAFVLPADVTTTVTASTAPTTTIPSATTVRSAATAGTVTASTTPPTTTPASTAPSATTVRSSTDAARTSPDATAGDEPADPARVSVVVVNGAGEAGLAGRTAKALNGKGYTDTATTDAMVRAEQTIILFAPGFEDEAGALAAALGLWAPLEPKPSAAVAVNGADVEADLVLLLGRST